MHFSAEDKSIELGLRHPRGNNKESLNFGVTELVEGLTAIYAFSKSFDELT
jgi:hypothetical protein